MTCSPHSSHVVTAPARSSGRVLVHTTVLRNGTDVPHTAVDLPVTEQHHPVVCHTNVLGCVHIAPCTTHAAQQVCLAGEPSFAPALKNTLLLPPCVVLRPDRGPF